MATISFHSSQKDFDKFVSKCGIPTISSNDGTRALSTDDKHQLTREPDSSASVDDKHQLSTEPDSSASVDDKHQLTTEPDSSALVDDKHQLSTEPDSSASADDKHQLSTEPDSSASADDKHQLTTEPDSSASNSQLPAAPHYRAARYRNMIGGRGRGSRTGQFKDLYGITTSPVSGNVIVADTWNNRIQILTQSLQSVSVFGDKGKKDGQFKLPWDVAVSKEDKIFVSDSDNHRIQVTDNIGIFMYKFGTKGYGTGMLKEPKGLAIDQDDLLYICDSKNYRIQVTRLNGEVVRSIGGKGSGPGQFMSSPKYITVSRKGNLKLVVSDYHGNLYILTTTGTHIQTIMANQPPHEMCAHGVAVDGYENIIIAHSASYFANISSCIVVLGETGDVITTIGAYGRAPGEIIDPTGITVTQSGDILLCDRFTNKVQMFTVPIS